MLPRVGDLPRVMKWQFIVKTSRVRRRTKDGTVALTFDDGPMPGTTDAVLDVLASTGVRATFFCVGKNARAHPELVRRMKAEGHAVGSHSRTHFDPAGVSTRQLKAEYAEGRALVASALGEDTRLFRPPHGVITPRQGLAIRGLGLKPWLWTVDPSDWRANCTEADILAVASTAAAGDVILLHDWTEEPPTQEPVDRSATILALQTLIPDLLARNLRLSTLPPN